MNSLYHIRSIQSRDYITFGPRTCTYYMFSRSGLKSHFSTTVGGFVGSATKLVRDRSPLFCHFCCVFFEFSNSTCFASRDFEKLQHVQVVSDKRLRDQQSQKFRPCNSANTKTLEFGAERGFEKKSRSQVSQSSVWRPKRISRSPRPKGATQNLGL